jgi:uncharacterized membrane protein YedE/YeeE
MSRLIASALIGAIFAVGLVISGMTLPAKVIGFLDLTGDWDPALGFVMAGAIGVHMSTRWLVLRRDGPVMGDAFSARPPTQIDRRLLIGAGLFGLGWLLAGYCPGPAIVSVGGAKAWIYVSTMIIGMALSRARS